MVVDVASRAFDFVKDVQLAAPLPPDPRNRGKAAFNFDAAKEQAAVVGSDVVAFVTGVTAEQRSDVVNATLLAQLAAKRKVAEPKTLPEVVTWYDHYFDALSQIGFLIQDKGFSQYVETSDNFEAHEAILEVAGALLASSPGALLVVKKTLDALQKMSAGSPWITLFNRESHSASTARFQVSVVDADPAGPFLVSLVAFGLQAQQSITQVLFFKFQRNTVQLQHHSGKATINAPVLASVRDVVAARLKDYASDFIAGLDL